MPIEIQSDEQSPIDFPDFLEALRESQFDPTDADSLKTVAPFLKRLYNNRTFLSDVLTSELKDHCVNQASSNGYSAQVVMLHAGNKDNFVVRANFWPSPKDSIFKSSGADPFFYNKAHNHNFNFLTIGYLGTGYWSDYYHLDYENVTGFPGEKVDLKFIEKSQLNEGRMLLYEANKDVHNQLPSDEMSVSINIMERTSRNRYMNQYSFDLETSKISTDVLSYTALEAVIELAAVLGGEEAHELISHISKNHPNCRIRSNAIMSLLMTSETSNDREALSEDYLRSNDNEYLSQTIKTYLKATESHPKWEQKYKDTLNGKVITP